MQKYNFYINNKLFFCTNKKPPTLLLGVLKLNYHYLLTNHKKYFNLSANIQVIFSYQNKCLDFDFLKPFVRHNNKIPRAEQNQYHQKFLTKKMHRLLGALKHWGICFLIFYISRICRVDYGI